MKECPDCGYGAPCTCGEWSGRGRVIPVVSGRMGCSNAEFERRCLVWIEKELEKIEPDNALIALASDGARLAREYSDALNPRPEKSRGTLYIVMGVVDDGTRNLKWNVAAFDTWEAADAFLVECVKAVKKIDLKDDFARISFRHPLDDRFVCGTNGTRYEIDTIDKR